MLHANVGTHLALRVALASAAWLIFAFGLVAPLTPSDGLPPLRALLTYAAAPLGLLSWAAAKATTTLGRLALIGQAVAMAGLFLWLLTLQAGLWR